MTRRRVTIKDIAKIAQVTPTTVSMVLNNRPRVSAETRRNILRIAHELNYQPDFIARSLRQKQTRTLGLIMKNIADPFYPELAYGISQTATERGYNVILCNVGDDQLAKNRTINLMRSRGVDGIISTTVLNDDPYLEQLVEESFPFVATVRVVTKSPLAEKIDSVSVDNWSGGYRAVDHLYKLGHDRIGIVAGSLLASTGRDRTAGAREALLDRRIEIDPELIVDCQFNSALARQAARRLLGMSKPPTAIFAQDDNMALGVREEVLKSGRRIPEDLALVGFDNIDTAGLTGIDLTTVNQRIYEMGARSVTVLLDRIEKKTLVPVQRIILPSELVVRKSCGHHPRGYSRA
ncbi:MAG: LacI family DNA-binding transcriptional regulator [Thermodesulfobacteriota bacterium]